MAQSADCDVSGTDVETDSMIVWGSGNDVPDVTERNNLVQLFIEVTLLKRMHAIVA